jgi:peptidoglycan/LPS O-acetylase OafA/YrhL
VSLDPAAIAAATPPDRDRYVDFLRAVAIAAVVVGHWLVADVTLTDGRFTGENALGSVALLRALTLVFQVMPLFFVVGGFANAASLAAAGRRADSAATWLQGRLVRLARPAVAFVAAWTALVVALASAGADDLAATAGRLVVLPLWFLPVYVGVTAAAPALLRAHRRHPVATLAGLAAGAVAMDLVRFGLGWDLLGLLNLGLVWLTFQQLGFWWLDGRLGRPDQGRRLLALAGLALIALVTVGPYPTDMVSAPGHGLSNTAPPTVALLAFGVAQFGAVLALRPPLERWLQRPRTWAVVVAVNLRAMTLYLWHFTAIVVAALVLLPLGVPQADPGAAAWWLLRPVWVTVEVVVLAGLVARWGRFERAGAPGPTTGRRAHGAALCFAAAFVALTTKGFWPGGGPNWLALGALALALAQLPSAISSSSSLAAQKKQTAPRNVPELATVASNRSPVEGNTKAARAEAMKNTEPSMLRATMRQATSWGRQ